MLKLTQFNDYKKKVNWLLFSLIATFTIGSWLDISGIWCELPLIVDTLPERWRLPSILTVISQMGHIGPLIYLLLRRFFPIVLGFPNAICAVLGLGSISCLLLALFWNKTEFIFGEYRSIYLYIFNFTLSTLDSLSTITFLPYIGEHFPKEYILPNYIGESLSALIPGLLSMIQGIGKSEECVNATLSSNITTILTTKPKFSVSVYFGILAILIGFCLVSFCVIHFSSLFDKIRKKGARMQKKAQVSDIESSDFAENKNNHNKDLRTPTFFMAIAFLMAFVQYGFLPGLMSYSCMPYGSNILYLSVNLGNCFLPVSIFLSMWSHQVSTKRILIELLIPFLCSIYIVFIAVLSPCPPFVYARYNLGGYFMVLCWILMSSIFIRGRCLIASKIESFEKNSLLKFGISSQFGQILGGVIIYVLVDVLRMFNDKPKCSPYEFCMNY